LLSVSHPSKGVAANQAHKIITIDIKESVFINQNYA
jgi:hypothetical protein